MRYLQPMAPVPAARHLLRAKDLADRRYADDVDVNAMAREAKLSPAHFSREFRRTFGEPPHRYLLTRRLERAAFLLRNTDRSVGASLSGYIAQTHGDQGLAADPITAHFSGTAGQSFGVWNAGGVELHLTARRAIERMHPPK